MNWFEGQIANAITQAKRQKSLFVVYIRGNNEDSEKMDKTWEEGEVANTCSEAQLVVMKFKADSEECKQFSVYYPVICVPCVYLISGETGMCLESIAGFASASDLVQKIKKVMQTLKEGSAAAPPPQQVAATSQPPVAAAQATPPAQSSNAAKAASPPGAEKESVQERAARMRQKMEEVHRKKEQQKQEAEKQKELERRKMGQNMLRADQQRADSQAKKAANDLRRERQEDKVAREKVLEQLARDKAEKEARFKSQKEQREKQRLQAQQEKDAAQKAEQAKRAASQLETAMIQFRLPDGSTLTNQFASGAPLQEALDFVTENVGPTLTVFTLSTTYPRRNFGPNEMQTSFLDLGLAPRAAIVVLPGRLTPTSSTQPSSQVSPASEEGGIFSWIMAPFLYFFNIIVGVFYGSSSSDTSSTSSPTSSASTSPSHSPRDEEPSTASRNTRDSGARPKSSYARRRAPASGASGENFARREGNIHRINTQQNDNDENNTWNGNSTQQM